MRAIRRAAEVWLALLRVGFAEAVAYRAEFLVWMLSFSMPLVMMAIWTAVATEAPVGRFDSPAFVSYYLATLVVRQMAGSWVLWELNMEIRSGALGLRLLKPVHPLLCYAAEGLAALPMRAAISLPIAGVLLYTSEGSHVTREPLALFAFGLALGAAWLINFCVSATIGTLALYTESAVGLWELWLGAFTVLSGYLIPLELFPAPVERIARALPFAYLQAVPVEILTGMRTPLEALAAAVRAWAWALGALTLLLFMWRRAVGRFAAYGG